MCIRDRNRNVSLELLEKKVIGLDRCLGLLMLLLQGEMEGQNLIEISVLLSKLCRIRNMKATHK